MDLYETYLYFSQKLIIYNHRKTNIMNNLNDIFNSDFFQTNFQAQIDADDKHLAQHGWTRAEIQSIADSVTK
tara:strand:+ start:628 stop:843 length:216 start_codon:yes stop_codon:yes gene_type:complete